jgi:hypothetical protein
VPATAPAVVCSTYCRCRAVQSCARIAAYRLERREGAGRAGLRHRPRLGQQQVGGLGRGVGDQDVEAHRHPGLRCLRTGPVGTPVGGQRRQPRLGVAGHAEQRPADDHRQPELRGHRQAAAGGQHVQRDVAVRARVHRHLRRPGEEGAQLGQVGGEVRLVARAQRAAHRWGEAGGAAQPQVDPAGGEGRQGGELLGDHQRLVVRQHHAR